MKLQPRLFLAMSVACLAGLAVFAAEEKAPAAARPDPWLPLRRFIGTWEGEARGEAGTGKAERTYAFVLNNRFIQVASKASYVPTEKKPKGEIHEDLGFFSYDRAQKKLLVRQFHVEGFVNLYALESISDDGRTLVFVTTAIENIAPGWRGRETYSFTGENEFTEKFELAEPGKDFAPYSEARFRRKAR